MEKLRKDIELEIFSFINEGKKPIIVFTSSSSRIDFIQWSIGKSIKNLCLVFSWDDNPDGEDTIILYEIFDACEFNLGNKSIKDYLQQYGEKVVLNNIKEFKNYLHLWTINSLN